MTLRKGIVVDTHPDDHSVDLVMTDDGSRLTGVQVSTSSGSSRTGSVDLPEVPKKKNKWDITERTDQDMIALVSYSGRDPVVTGFLYPQVNQMLFKDPKMRFNRHQSDVMSYTDGDGNFGIMHPSGAYIQVGEKPDKPDLKNKNADQSLNPDRNTGKKVYLRVSLGANVAELTMTPEGSCTLKLKQNLDIECKQATVKATDGMKFDTPEAHFTGKVTSDGDMIAGSVSLQNHKNTGVRSGPDTSGPPEK